jgi:hypothetical protein
MKAVSWLSLLLGLALLGGLAVIGFFPTSQPGRPETVVYENPPPPTEPVETVAPTPAPPPPPVPLGPVTEADLAAIPTSRPLIDIDQVHPLPVFPTLADLQADPSKIPDDCRPREVALTADTPFSMGASGQIIGKAGTLTTVTKIDNSTLHLSLSSAQATLPMTSTDFWSRVEKAYTAQTTSRLKAVESQRAQAAAKNKALLDERAARAAKVGPRPQKNSGGIYEALRTALENDTRLGIPPDRIKTWDDPVFEIINQEPYWTVVIRYESEGPMGTLNERRKLLIQQGKILHIHR